MIYELHNFVCDILKVVKCIYLTNYLLYNRNIYCMYCTQQEGNRTLFAQALEVAKKQNLAGVANGNDAAAGTNFFLTSLEATNNNLDNMSVLRELRLQENVDRVMQEVVDELKITSTSQVKRNPQSGDKLNDVEKVPVQLFDRSLADPHSMKRYPMSMGTALKYGVE
jgi:hypothetical protein